MAPLGHRLNTPPSPDVVIADVWSAEIAMHILNVLVQRAAGPLAASEGQEESAAGYRRSEFGGQGPLSRRAEFAGSNLGEVESFNASATGCARMAVAIEVG